LSFWDSRDVLLWHGTTLDRASSIVLHGPDLFRSRKSLDFGQGFYLTTREERAVDWSREAAHRTGKQPAVVLWTVPYDAFFDWPKVAFADAGQTAGDFWSFIQMNRELTTPHRSRPHDFFDIVIGPASANYRRRSPVRELDQISFHTDAALALLAAHPPEVLTVTP
jgi:hypothetical protein